MEQSDLDVLRTVWEAYKTNGPELGREGLKSIIKILKALYKGNEYELCMVIGVEDLTLGRWEDGTR